MRTVIFIGLLAIAYSISPDNFFMWNRAGMVVIAALASALDIVEFIMKL